ncbi:uncharacterized protein LOC116413807 [Galleria mellonella]|uniref:Uncharacterized protein LOC116413807 n=1 Tax=Galleria mellonella TaxID=7137 RepID=A0ABM3MAQ7_GALME|nr:uncharacterized protein LOC116413807 [Galleria mellonella]
MNLNLSSRKTINQYCIENIINLFTELPEWVIIYYMKQSATEYKCNICEKVLTVFNEKSMDLFHHIKDNHKEVYDLHKDNTSSSPAGYHIEFLHLNVLRDDGDPENEPVFIGEVCEATTEEMTKPVIDKIVSVSDCTVSPVKKKKLISLETRRRSWVWKYFTKVKDDNTMFQCNLCNIVLSIKGCNTNNMNRHVKTRHADVYDAEIYLKKDKSKEVDFEQSEDMEAFKVMDDSCENINEELESDISAMKRRSWVWSYFNQMSGTIAQCKLCNRSISHGGNATGNMNRHLKMIHNKTQETDVWVWKVFDQSHPKYYTCKICQYKCSKNSDKVRTMSLILDHLKDEHGVVSCVQIITAPM